MDGPLSAPSSPPEMPVPTKWMPCSRSSFSRRRVSSKWALPPSMIDVALLQQRGELADHRVGRVARLHHDHQPPGALQRGDELLGRLARRRRCPRRRAPRPGRSVLAAVRLCTATVKPLRAKLRARLLPMTASPVTPMSADPLICRSWGEVRLPLRSLCAAYGPAARSPPPIGDRGRDRGPRAARTGGAGRRPPARGPGGPPAVGGRRSPRGPAAGPRGSGHRRVSSSTAAVISRSRSSTPAASAAAVIGGCASPRRTAGRR